MRSRNAIAAAAIVSAVFVGACAPASGPMDPQAYAKALQADRTAKDASFRTSSDSPIPAEQRAAFTGLAYYAIDDRYRVPARLQREDTNPPKIIEMDTSTHRREKMRRVGTLQFSLDGVGYTLGAFVEADAPDVDKLFVPFSDLTSGTETYHGGRFLDLSRTATGLYDLDFNRAYHPLCLYNSDYECPIPPIENRLPVAIRAGERLGDAGKK